MNSQKSRKHGSGFSRRLGGLEDLLDLRPQPVPVGTELVDYERLDVPRAEPDVHPLRACIPSATPGRRWRSNHLQHVARLGLRSGERRRRVRTWFDRCLGRPRG